MIVPVYEEYFWGYTIRVLEQNDLLYVRVIFPEGNSYLIERCFRDFDVAKQSGYQHVKGWAFN